MDVKDSSKASRSERKHLSYREAADLWDGTHHWQSNSRASHSMTLPPWWTAKSWGLSQVLNVVLPALPGCCDVGDSQQAPCLLLDFKLIHSPSPTGPQEPKYVGFRGTGKQPWPATKGVGKTNNTQGLTSLETSCMLTLMYLPFS